MGNWGLIGFGGDSHMGIDKEFDGQDMFIDARPGVLGLEDVEETKSAPRQWQSER